MINNEKPIRRYFTNFLSNLGKMNLATVFWLVILIGVIMLLLSFAIAKPKQFDVTESTVLILHEIGILCVTVMPILFFYEGILRNHHITEMEKAMKNAIDETGLDDKILQVLERRMPNSYNNLVRLGVSDAFESLDPMELRSKIEFCTGEITILKIFIPYLSDYIKKQTIREAVRCGANFRIILCDPELEEPLMRRSKTVPDSNLKSYKNAIERNLEYFQAVWVDLKKIGHENKVEIRLHNGFISTSLIGFSEYYLLGLYLNNRMANQGMQIRVDKDIKEGTRFYNELKDHFEFQWDDAVKMVVFNEKDYQIIPRK